jgi:hypothetical protein
MDCTSTRCHSHGSSQLATLAKDAKTTLTEKLEAVADRGYFNGEEILACEEATSR